MNITIEDIIILEQWLYKNTGVEFAFRKDNIISIQCTDLIKFEEFIKLQRIKLDGIVK
jgi:hypothetical protein